MERTSALLTTPVATSYNPASTFTEPRPLPPDYIPVDPSAGLPDDKSADESYSVLSEADRRPSAIVVGTFAIFIVIGEVACIVLLDAPTLCMHFRYITVHHIT